MSRVRVAKPLDYNPGLSIDHQAVLLIREYLMYNVIRSTLRVYDSLKYGYMNELPRIYYPTRFYCGLPYTVIGIKKYAGEVELAKAKQELLKQLGNWADECWEVRGKPNIVEFLTHQAYSIPVMGRLSFIGADGAEAILGSIYLETFTEELVP
jgi:hypothetical protein